MVFYRTLIQSLLSRLSTLIISFSLDHLISCIVILILHFLQILCLHCINDLDFN